MKRCLPACLVAQEEIFGPVQSILKYHTTEEVGCRAAGLLAVLGCCNTAAEAAPQWQPRCIDPRLLASTGS